MKYFLIGVGVIISTFAGIKISNYLLDYQQLSEFGKGYVIGNVLLLIIGIILIAWGWKKGKQVGR